MKRKTMAVLLGTLLCATCLFAACDDGTDRSLGSQQFSVDIRQEDDLRGYVLTSSYSDSLGWVTLQKTENGETVYMLYNMISGEQITSSSAFIKRADGLYYTDETDRPVYYGKGGKFDSSGAGGNQVYVAPDGTLHKYAPASANEPPLQYSSLSSAQRIGDSYYAVFQTSFALSLYGTDGKFLRHVNIAERIDIAQAAKAVYWALGNKAFMQLDYTVAGGYYDYVAGGVKHRLDTYVYDVETDTVEECPNMHFKVLGVEYEGMEDQSFLVLRGQSIGEDKCLSTERVQTFGQDGKVWIDLQKLMPGASEIVFGQGGKVILCDGLNYAVFAGGECVATYPADGCAEYCTFGGFLKNDIYYSENGSVILDASSREGSQILYAPGVLFGVRTETTTGESRRVMEIWSGENWGKTEREIVASGAFLYLTESAEEGEYDLYSVFDEHLLAGLRINQWSTNPLTLCANLLEGNAAYYFFAVKDDGGMRYLTVKLSGFIV